MAKLNNLQAKKIIKESIAVATAEHKKVKKGLGGGLELLVQPSGKTDYYYREGHKTQKLGSTDKITLANAYKKVDALKPKNKVRKERNTTPLLKDYFLEWIEEKAKTFKTGSNRKSTLMAFFNNTLTPLHNVKMSDITLKLVYEKIESTGQTPHNKHDSVSALLACLNNACIKGIIETVPFTKNPFPKPKGGHRHSIGYTQLKIGFFEPLSIKGVSYIKKCFFLLLALNGFRFDECRNLKWKYINFNKGLIVIPPDAVHANKAQRETKKPMTVQTTTLLLNIKKHYEALGIKSEYVFATHTPRFNGPMCENSFREPHKTLVKDVYGQDSHDLHGFRSCVKTFLMDHGFHSVASEDAIHHNTRTKIEQIYDRGERLEDLRTALQTWADYLTDSQLTKTYRSLLR